MSAITLRVQDSLDQQIRELAAKQQMSLSDFARNALETYVKQVQQEMRVQEMVKAATAMQQNPDIKQSIAKLTLEMEFDNASTLEDDQGWWK